MKHPKFSLRLALIIAIVTCCKQLFLLQQVFCKAADRETSSTAACVAAS
jgi:hypothetical protein